MEADHVDTDKMIDQLSQERMQAIASWISTWPGGPPNVVGIEITVTYDDGMELNFKGTDAA